jgi:rhodanese-related sulfurtransferase
MSLLNSLKSALNPAPRITPAEARERIQAGTALLVDVREPVEWASGVADGATLLSVKDLTGERKQWRAFLTKVGQREVICYCAAGGRAGTAAGALRAEGFTASNGGGLSDWAKAGWPIVKPKT